MGCKTQAPPWGHLQHRYMPQSPTASMRTPESFQIFEITYSTGIWLPSPYQTWEDFKDTLNGFGALSWNIKEPSDHTTFLDLEIGIQDQRLTFKTNQKEHNLYLYIPPSSAHPYSCLITYSSIVSRNSGRIAILIAALNDWDLLATNIGNAYLNVSPCEKVYTTREKSLVQS